MDRHALRRLGNIRRRIAKFGATSRLAKIEDPGYALACLSDQAFLLAMYDELCRQLAHPSNTPTTALASVPALPPDADRPFSTPVAPRVPLPADDGWNAAIVAAEMRIETTITEGIRTRLDIYAIKANIASAFKALRRQPPTG